MRDREVVWPLLLLFAVILGAIFVGAWTGFPVYNDAYLVGFVRELGPASILANHPDQPVYGFLLQSLAMAFGWSRGPYIVISLASWILLAWQAKRLWERLYPEEPRLSPLAALLVLSPILVQTQYTTVTGILRANLPVSMCLCALLVCLGSEGENRRSLWISAALVMAASVMTEYGVGASVACAALLLFLRRSRAAGVLLAGSVAGYLVFRVTANVHTEENVDPSILLPRVLGNPAVAAARWVVGVWHCLLGAWLSAAGGISMDQLRTATATAAGLLAAFAMIRALRGEPPVRLEDRRRLAASCMAVAFGLVPVVLANRAVNLPASDSRHRTHVLVFAVIALLAFTSRVVAIRFRKAAFVFLAFLAAYWVVIGAVQTLRDQNLFEEVGDRLLPLVRSSPGITVAVLPGQTLATDLTPKATMRWRDEEAKRAWILLPGQAERLFGPRAGCHDTHQIKTIPELHSTGRRGPVSHLVWVSVVGQSVEELEPYCVDRVSAVPLAAGRPVPGRSRPP
jgi:hypothetical protein